MIEITAPRQHRDWQARNLPPVERIGEGLWSLPVPMPGYGLTYLLAYVLELPDGIAIIDTGWPSEEAWQGLLDGLRGIGFGPEHVRAIVATHVHTDHYGLAERLRAASGAWIGMHPADAVTSLSDDIPAELRARRTAWLEQRRSMGIPSRRRDTDDGQSRARRGDERRGGPRDEDANEPAWHRVYATRPDVLLADGDRLDLPGWDLRALWTPGHSPGHLCLHDEQRGLLFGGDHVLPKVTPHVSLTSGQPGDPLGDFLDSLRAVRDLAVDEVLPAHEYRYAGLGERADQLIAHHRERLAEIELVLARDPGATCWQVTRALSWSRPLDTQPASLRRTALKETLAHLVRLERDGRVRAEGTSPTRWHAST